ncbi:MAG: hypothetical protein IPP29_15050 [Bacteroidetes bacterium]|nr:hypothetical protein [Bacteroidota bacterium]
MQIHSMHIANIASAGTGYKTSRVSTNPIKAVWPPNAFTINACEVPNPSALARQYIPSITWADATWPTAKYQIRYRVNGTANHKQIDVDANNNLKNILNLVSATTYQWQLRSMCESSRCLLCIHCATTTFTPHRVYCGVNYSSAEKFLLSLPILLSDVNVESAKPVSINSIEYTTQYVNGEAC